MTQAQIEPEVDKLAAQAVLRSSDSSPLKLQADTASAQAQSPTPLRRHVPIATTDPVSDSERTPSPLGHRRASVQVRRRHIAPPRLGGDVHPTLPQEAVRRRLSPDGDLRRGAIQVTPDADNIEALLGRDLLRRVALLNSFTSPPQRGGQDPAADGVNRRADVACQGVHDNHDDEELSIVLCPAGSKLSGSPAAGWGGDRLGLTVPATMKTDGSML